MIGEVIELAIETTFGRTRGNDVVIPHGFCSKRHARILFTNRQFVLLDLGSTNGVQVNGADHQPHARRRRSARDRVAEFRFELIHP